ncbi:MAG: HAMP domain-containing histidine kinase, partial [Fibrobacteria bacterium]|nr:HAMP domain-containing histidine kinase [Fibrobacteria bacterium]
VFAKNDKLINQWVFVVNSNLIEKYFDYCRNSPFTNEIINSTIVLSGDVVTAVQKITLLDKGVFLVVDPDTPQLAVREKINWLIAQKYRSITHSMLVTRLNSEFKNHQQHVKSQSNLLQMAVHDLRSPLSAMICYSELLMDGFLNDIKEKGINPINIIHQNCQFLIDMVNDLLDLAQLEAGKKKLKLLRTNLVTIIKKVIRSLDGLTRAKHIVIITDFENIPDFFADTQKMERVVINLLGNAIKFTKSNGTIHIKCSKKGNFISLAIQDTGPGISKKDINKIFEKFNMGNGSKISGKGHGLGLAITRSFVELHGGSIFVESERHKGSTFVVHLPIEKRLESHNVYAEKRNLIFDIAQDIKGLESLNKLANAPVSYFTSDRDLMRELPDVGVSCFIINESFEFGSLSRRFFSIILQGRMSHIPCVVLIPSQLTSEESEMFKYLNIFFLKKPITILKLKSEITKMLEKERRKELAIQL